MIFEEIKNIDSSNKKLREFGLLIGFIAVIISALLIYKGNNSYLYFGGIGLALILLGIVFPKALLPFQKGWMIFAVILGFFSTRIILGILFYLVITPMGLAAKLFGKDFLDRKTESEKISYWIKRKETEYGKEETERQF